jgi:phosphoribosylformimino-5-aminoimidazole carboxamide ribonucleotide (ProFAR) isomerase
MLIALNAPRRGVARVIIGTLAIEQPRWRLTSADVAGHIAISLDARLAGWLRKVAGGVPRTI